TTQGPAATSNADTTTDRPNMSQNSVRKSWLAAAWPSRVRSLKYSGVTAEVSVAVTMLVMKTGIASTAKEASIAGPRPKGLEAETWLISPTALVSSVPVMSSIAAASKWPRVPYEWLRDRATASSASE